MTVIFVICMKILDPGQDENLRMTVIFVMCMNIFNEDGMVTGTH